MDNIIPAIINFAGAIIAAIIAKPAKENKNKQKKLTLNQYLLILILIVSILNSIFILNGYQPFVNEENCEPTGPSNPPTETVDTTAPTTEPAVNEYPQYTPGKKIKFGTYEQDNNEVNGTESIKWIVLTQEEDQVLLISALGLDSYRYEQSEQESDWYNSSLREWLNGDFYNNAFTETEKIGIVKKELTQHTNTDYPNTDQGEETTDCVFLLSSQEYLTYLHGNGNIKEQERYGKPSTAAKKNYTPEKKLDLSNNKYCWWWLRTSGQDLGSACIVTAYGELNPGRKDINTTGGLVRPAIWVNTSFIEET